MIAPLLALTLLATAPAGAPDPEALLRDSDRARGALPEGATWTVVVDSTEEGETTRRSYLVRARGVDALCEALSPPRHKGEVIVFNDRTIWYVKPGLRRPIAISARQRLQGQHQPAARSRRQICPRRGRDAHRHSCGRRHVCGLGR